jgi:hypothetical protein
MWWLTATIQVGSLFGRAVVVRLPRRLLSGPGSYSRVARPIVPGDRGHSSLAARPIVSEGWEVLSQLPGQSVPETGRSGSTARPIVPGGRDAVVRLPGQSFPETESGGSWSSALVYMPMYAATPKTVFLG